MSGNSKHTSGNLLSRLGAENKDIGTTSQTSARQSSFTSARQARVGAGLVDFGIGLVTFFGGV